MDGAGRSSPQRALFVLPSYETGGSQRVLLTLAANVDRQRFMPELVVFDAAGGLQHLVPPDLPVTDLKRPRLRQAIPALLGALRRRQPQVVFSTLGYVNLAVLALRPLLGFQTRIVIRESNLPSQALHRLRGAPALRAGYRLLYRTADRVVAQSDRMLNELEQFSVPRHRLERLPNPVDVPSVRAAAKAPRRHPGTGLRLVAMGHLIPQKGYDLLLGMMASLPPDTRLIIFGDGSERRALEQQAVTLGIADRVSLPGFVRDPWPDLAGADAFVMPSRWEGMPNAALEALAAGVPVIATPEAGGLDEVASACGPGALSLASAGEPFVAALRALRAEPKAVLRPSLLPRQYELENVLSQFERILS